MENAIKFGTFIVPDTNTESSFVSYVAPSILPEEMQKRISFGEGYICNHEKIMEKNIEEQDEVTHSVFFGENIKRVRNALFS